MVFVRVVYHMRMVSTQILGTSIRFLGLYYSILKLKQIRIHHTISLFSILTSISLRVETNEGMRVPQDSLQAVNLSDLLMAFSLPQQLSLNSTSDRVRKSGLGVP